MSKQNQIPVKIAKLTAESTVKPKPTVGIDPSSPLITEGWLLAKRLDMALNPEIELKRPDSLFSKLLAQHLGLRQYTKYLELKEDSLVQRLTLLHKLAKEALHEHRAGNVIQFPLKADKEAPREEIVSRDLTEDLIEDLELRLDEVKTLRSHLLELQEARLLLFKKQRLELRMEGRRQAEEIADQLQLTGEARKQFVAQLEERGLFLPQVLTQIQQHYDNQQEKSLSKEENKAYNDMRKETLRSAHNAKKMMHVMELNILFAIMKLEGVDDTQKRQMQLNVRTMVNALKDYANRTHDTVQIFKKEYVDVIQQDAETNQQEIDQLTKKEVATVQQIRQSLKNIQHNPTTHQQLSRNASFQQFMKMLPKTVLVLKYENRRVERRVDEQLKLFDAPKKVPMPCRTEATEHHQPVPPPVPVH